MTLRVYAHLMPSSSERARRALDDVFGTAQGRPTGYGTAPCWRKNRW
ncbi:hypothetical protein [Streptomyces hilarionis]